MKRDMDLVRLLLIHFEGEEKVDLSEYTEDQIYYHMALLISGGLAEGPIPLYSKRLRKESDIPIAVNIDRLTWSGHEFLDQARNSGNWEKAKKYVVDKGQSLTIESIKVALGIVIKSVLS